MKHVTRNPYAGVRWDTYGRHKAALHEHTTESDGYVTPADVIDLFAERGYGILAITDHDNMAPGPIVNDMTHGQPTWPWTAYGRNPEDLGMLGVPAVEFTWVENMGGYYTDPPMWTDDDHTSGLYYSKKGSIDATLTEVATRTGLAHMAHPGRYEGQFTDQWYVDAHLTHRCLRGMEMLNELNRYPADTARYDRVLALAIEQGHTRLPLWAWSVDDGHYLEDYGRNYHVHLMPERTHKAFRESLTAGAFWIVQDPWGGAVRRHIDPARPGFFSAAPIITSIRVTSAAITIRAAQHTQIRWITNGTTQIHTGPTLPLDTEGLGTFVRAELDGTLGAFSRTQPFYLGDGHAPVAPIDGETITGIRLGGAPVAAVRH